MRIDHKARRESMAERTREEQTGGGKGRLTENEAREDHPKKVLFVCRANICRSPMAEAILNAMTEDRGLAYRTASAGVAALVDEDIVPNARTALEEVGIYAGEHRARQVSEAMLEEADLVLAMSLRQVETLRRRFGLPTGKFYTLPEYALGAPPEEGIPDPYGLTMTAFRASVRQLLDCVDGLVERLEREGAFR